MPVEGHEAQLTARARSGDKNAYGDLYELHLDRIYGYISYRLNNTADAEDMTEEVFLKAWEGLPNFRGSVPFKVWIYRIARNLVYDHYRTRKQSEPLDENAGLDDGSNNPEEQILIRETSERLMKAVGKLSQLHQDVIVLRFVGGNSLVETAQIMEREAGTVRVLQHRAIKALRSILVAGEIVDG